jgi:aspartate ammonia-lyase
MSSYRTEKDWLGIEKIPSDALYGIHTLRAMENFPLAGVPVNRSLVHAYGAVKLAAARTNREQGRWTEATFRAIETACREMMEGRLDAHISVDALQGGAGTSTNMNINEVLANRALQILGKAPGDYQAIDPIGDINLHQSTNDTYPTALKVAALTGIRSLEAELVTLVEAFQRKEKEMAHVVKMGRTELQDAVLTTLGRTMGAFAEAFGRDRWRVHQCEERLRVVNLGGTAIGTGLSAPREYIFSVVEHLKEVTGLGLARAENLVECTQNADVYVEVSGILNAVASNLLKVSNDLRLMSSGPDAGLGEISLPSRAAGSSIMPGKVNPVIPEAVSQAALTAMSNGHTIAAACARGELELNAFLPLVAEKLLESLQILGKACRILATHCVNGLVANERRCREQVDGATATLTALVGRLGYKQAEAVGRRARESGVSIRQVVIEMNLLTEQEYQLLTSAEAVTRLGSKD